MRTCTFFFRVQIYYAGEFQVTATSAAAATTTTTTTSNITTASVPVQEMYVLHLICKHSGVWDIRWICK